MMLSMIFVMITMSAASVRRIEEVFKEEPGIRNPERPVMDVADGSVDFNSVCFSYGKGKEDAGGTDKGRDKGKDKGRGRQALSDIELHIRSGETVGIIGGTGSGKSSLVNLISRLYDADSGSVCVGGRDVREYDLEIRWQWFCRKMYCFPARFWRICGGEIRMPRKKNAGQPAGRPVLTNS